MAAERLPHHSIALDSNRPLIGVFPDDDTELVHYLAEDPAEPLQSPSAGARDALTVIGAWSDLDWDELAESLDRIRHQSQPTPPIDLDDV